MIDKYQQSIRAKYLSFLHTTWLHYTQALSVQMMYRFSIVQGFVGVLLNLLGLIYFWLAASRSMPPTSDYSPQLLVTYFVIASALGIVQENGISHYLSESIRMGKLSASLLRPYPFLWSVLAQAAAFVTMRILFLLPITLALICFTDLLLWKHLDSLHLTMFLSALLLSIILGWLVRTLVGMLAFKMTQTWGPDLIFISFFALASGSAYPSDLLPTKLQNIISWSPPYYMVGFPSMVLTGRLSHDMIIQGLNRGSFMLLICMIAVVIGWRRGIRHFEAIGI